MDQRDVILVTGSSGNIGTATIERLAEKYRLAGFDQPDPTPPTQPAVFVAVDMESQASIQAGLKSIREKFGERLASVIHLAGYYSFSGEPSPKYYTVNVLGTQHLLDGLQTFQVEQFVFASTMLVYQPTEPGRPINEQWPLDPQWDYPKSKVETEAIIAAHHNKIPTINLRLAGVYTDDCLVPSIANQIQLIYERQLISHVFPGDLTHGQAFLHLDDLVDAFALLVERRKQLPAELTINIGEPDTYSYGSLQHALGRLIHGEEWETREIPKAVAKTGAWLEDVALPKDKEPFIKPWMIDMGFSPDHRTLDVVSIGSNSVTFIDTASNRVKHTTYVGRSPHEAMFTPDGKEVWVTVRGEDYVQVLDAQSYAPTRRITVPNGPGTTIFSPDGKYGYVVSSFTPEMVVIDVKTHQIVARVKQPSPFSPDLAATPDGKQLWYTLKDIGKTQVIDARPPFGTIATLDSGPITNHVNIARTAKGQFAYVTVGGLNAVKVYTTSDHPELVATIATGALPHGLWPSGDGTRMYVGLENDNSVAAIDTATNQIVTTVATGQSPQGMVFIPEAVPSGSGTDNLIQLGTAGEAVHLTMGAPGTSTPSTTLVINNQGLVDIVQAAVAGIEPKKPFMLALSNNADGSGALDPIARFMSNPAGAAIVGAVGPLRKSVQGAGGVPRRYLVVAPIVDDKPGVPIQIQQ